MYFKTIDSCSLGDHLGGSLTYNTGEYQKRYTRNNPESAKILKTSGDFPNCKGLYPDCPETPDLMNKMCRTCPKTDGIKKPKPESDE